MGRAAEAGDTDQQARPQHANIRPYHVTMNVLPRKNQAFPLAEVHLKRAACLLAMFPGQVTVRRSYKHTPAHTPWGLSLCNLCCFHSSFLGESKLIPEETGFVYPKPPTHVRRYNYLCYHQKHLLRAPSVPNTLPSEASAIPHNKYLFEMVLIAP